MLKSYVQRTWFVEFGAVAFVVCAAAVGCSGRSRSGDDDMGSGGAGAAEAGSGGESGSGSGGKTNSGGEAAAGHAGTGRAGSSASGGRTGHAGSGGDHSSNEGGSPDTGGAPESAGDGNTPGGAGGVTGTETAGAGGDCGSGSCCPLGWVGAGCDVRPVSCKALLAAFPSASSGTYTIDPDGTGSIAAFDAYCDMTFDGGGWTLIMATDSLGTDAQTVGAVALSSGRHLALGTTVALAAVGVSSQIHIRSHAKPDTASITSTADSLPIQNLRNGQILNDNSGIYSSSAAVNDWTGPYATAPHLWHSCGPQPYGTVAGYPEIWWSCNNGDGLHINASTSGWVADVASAEDMEVYLR